MNLLFVRVLAAGLLASAGPAAAMTLDEAVVLAMSHEPGLQRAEAEADAAGAQLRQAEASRGPSVGLTAQAGEGRTDFGAFFGFGEHAMSPRAASVRLQQPLFAAAPWRRASRGRMRERPRRRVCRATRGWTSRRGSPRPTGKCWWPKRRSG